MRVIASGPCARFTDQGRVGHQHKGFAQSGALDINSHTLANSILGKSFDNPTIEVLFGGLVVKATEDIVMVVTGADTRLKIENSEQLLNTAFYLMKGQTLSLDAPKLGLRNYIACHKNFDLVYFLDSCCEVAREKSNMTKQGSIGLQVDDVVTYVQNKNTILVNDVKRKADDQVSGGSNKVTPLVLTKLANEYIIRVVLGYQHTLFDHKMKALFFNQRYSVSTDTNSMGMRLEGMSVGTKSVKMYSEGIANGAVQITPNGLPIVMLRERQTIGGYPKIGSVISNDLSELGQCRPGTYLRFEECDMHTARQLWLLRHTRMINFATKRSLEINKTRDNEK
jgi:biotin-dependent carboxylase-like uncharacterized protein